MPDGARSLLLVISVLLAPAPAGGGANVGRIVEPTADSPLEIGAGDPLQAIARLRLPLTPPPGVQQPKAWDGWTVRLSRRVDLALGGVSPVIDYPARLLRIRPAGGDRYRITAEPPPWLPPGRYDLAIDGPGFEGLSAEAVVVRREGESRPSPQGGWRPRGEQVVDFVGPTSGDERSLLEVAVPADGSGFRAVSAAPNDLPRSSFHLVDALWTTAPGADGTGNARLLRFAVGGTSVRIERVPGRRCRAEIRWIDGTGNADPTEWRELELGGIEDPVTVVWDFGDGEHGVGRRVRHRWIFSSEAHVSATGFDGLGVPCTATARVSGNLAPRRGCGCSVAGRSNRRQTGASGLLDFFLSVTLARE